MINEQQEQQQQSPGQQQPVTPIAQNNRGFIAGWTMLIVVGLVIQFMARLIDYDNNPFAFYYPPLAAFAGIGAALIILFGYFTIGKAKAQQPTVAKRRGILLIVLGAIMLVGFFIFKEIMPLIFG